MGEKSEGRASRTVRVQVQAQDAKPQTREVRETKARAKKKEAHTWSVRPEHLRPGAQRQALALAQAQDLDPDPSLVAEVQRHVRAKLAGYRQQDQRKQRYCPDAFATPDCVRDLVAAAAGRCHYCSEEVLLLYEHVMEQKQWTLDRIDNRRGHDADNVVLACLACNLRRRCTHKDAFRFAKQLRVVKLGAPGEAA
jgi:hypothetical protein